MSSTKDLKALYQDVILPLSQAGNTPFLDFSLTEAESFYTPVNTGPALVSAEEMTLELLARQWAEDPNSAALLNLIPPLKTVAASFSVENTDVQGSSDISDFVYAMF